MSESSITIRGVPASVTREQLREALGVLGIDPAELLNLALRHRGIEVEVCASDRPGSPAHRWTHDGETVATHRLIIPIIEGERPGQP